MNHLDPTVLSSITITELRAAIRASIISDAMFFSPLPYDADVPTRVSSS